MSDKREFESTWKIPEDYREHRDSPPVLPEKSKLKITGRIVELVNSCRTSKELQATIPPLREEDIWVCTDASLLRYQRQKSFQLQHSLRTQALQDLAQKMGATISEAQPVILTEGSIPGKPVFFPESEIAEWSSPELKATREDARQAFQEITIGNVLAHENLHRATKSIVNQENAVSVSPEDPLFHLAFATDRLLSEKAVTGNFLQRVLGRGALRGIFNQLREYAKNHHPAILTEGARIWLFCEDTDGTRRVVAESGYDLHELTVDTLTLQFMGPMINYMKGKYISEVADAAINSIMEMSASAVGSARYPQLLPDPLQYFDELNLRTPTDVLNTYVDSEIPYIHARLLPRREYFA